jgi:hypothetical protein
MTNNAEVKEEEIFSEWWAYSKHDGRFDIYGYSTEGGDHRDDALQAMEVLAKHLGEPIPSDIELTIIRSKQ